MTLEEGVRTQLAAGALAEAARRTLEAHGPEIMSFLVAVTRDDTDADDAFSLFCIALCSGLPGFRWQSSLRTWVYVLARSALGRLARERGAARRETPLTPELEETVAAVRSTRGVTTGTHGRLDRLREGLDPDDHMLLVLRVNRELPWIDIARVMSGDEELAADEEARVTAALRKRWQRLKEEMRRAFERTP